MLKGYSREFSRPYPKEAFAMAASPVRIVSIPVSISRRRPLELTQRRLAANRRNATRSTGPRTAAGKAKVARNPIKHGFFAGPEKWTPQQRCDFAETLEGLRDEFHPQGTLEESFVAAIAQSYIRMAAMLRYENIAALKYHEQCDREFDERIAAADSLEAARLGAHREDLRRAGLWRPTIPGPREAKAIIRYSGRLDRTIRQAASELEGLRALRSGAVSRNAKVQKQTHYSATPNSDPEALRRAYAQRFDDSATPNSDPEALRRAYAQRFDDSATPNSGPEPAEGPQAAGFFEAENAKTNPLSSMFTGNRHERRRAKALARKQRRRPNP
jgi:hypothetical protein